MQLIRQNNEKKYITTLIQITRVMNSCELCVSILYQKKMPRHSESKGLHTNLVNTYVDI